MEKIIKREDGTRYEIKVEHTSYGFWNVWVSMCEPKKRTFKRIVTCNDYGYRNVSFGNERENYIMSKYLEHVTEDEIRDTINEAAELLKCEKFKAGIV